MNLESTIYVALLNEGVDVWRPVQAEHVGNNVYQIIVQPYDRSVERWEFEPGTRVICENIQSSEGIIYAAVRKAA